MRNPAMGLILNRRRLAALVGSGGTAWALVAACSGPPEVNYGDPTGLRSGNIPGEGGLVITSACEAGLPADIKNREAGSIDAGGCGVSFSVDLYPRFLGDGGWRCAASTCHGGQQVPLIDASTPESVLASLRSQSVGGLQYIPLNNRDPQKSSIYCNLARSCGKAMPPSPLPSQEVCALETWLKCGSPGN